MLCPGFGSDEAVRVELMVERYQQRAEAAKSWGVIGGGAPDYDFGRLDHFWAMRLSAPAVAHRAPCRETQRAVQFLRNGKGGFRRDHPLGDVRHVASRAAGAS